MKKSMKRLLVITLAGALTTGGAITSYAWNNLDEIAEAVESKREQVNEELPAEIEELENVTIPELEEKVKEAQQAYDDEIADDSDNYIDPMKEINLSRAEGKLSNAVHELEQKKKDLESAKYHLSELEKEYEQRTKLAYDPSYTIGDNTGDGRINSELRATFFAIDNKDGQWLLMGEYRGWNPLMGGSWYYRAGVEEDLEIGFYIDGECIESELSRAESYDTETMYAWSIPCDLEYSTFYTIEMHGIQFSVSTVGKDTRSKSKTASTNYTSDTEDIEDDDIDDIEDDDTEDVVDTEYTSQGTTGEASISTDYPAFYDANLADDVPNKVYYAQHLDDGWVATFDGKSLYYIDRTECVTGWLYLNNHWYCFNSDGYQVTGWITVGGYWYVVNPGTGQEDSYMLTGWQELNGKWYYFNTSGQMVANCVVDGYTIGADGVWVQ